MAKEQTVVVKSSGVGLGGLLLVLFVALKLTHNISWSWVWVVSPLWLPLGAVLAFALAVEAVALVVAGIKGAVGAVKARRRRSV